MKKKQLWIQDRVNNHCTFRFLFCSLQFRHTAILSVYCRHSEQNVHRGSKKKSFKSETLLLIPSVATGVGEYLTALSLREATRLKNNYCWPITGMTSLWNIRRFNPDGKGRHCRRRCILISPNSYDGVTMHYMPFGSRLPIVCVTEESLHTSALHQPSRLASKDCRTVHNYSLSPIFLYCWGLTS
ncbi:hypothetical protein FKM82_004181 [Ascaphus truei]